MKAYVFPGQASQYVGMGADLFDRFSHETAAASDILGYCIRTLCLHDPENKLDDTQYTQPAVYVVSCLQYLQLLQDGREKPDYLAGHSLGEYCALFAAGAFDFAKGLELVKERSLLMSQQRGGAMAAVMTRDDSAEQVVEEVCAMHRLSTIDVANYNSPKQIVVSGLKQDIENAEDHFDAAGASYYILPVSGAFHSRYMVPVAKEFGSVLQHVNFSTLNIPVIANIDGQIYESESIRENLTAQLHQPVQWMETILNLIDLRVESFDEVGPGELLKNLIMDIQDSIKTGDYF